MPKLRKLQDSVHIKLLVNTELYTCLISSNSQSFKSVKKMQSLQWEAKAILEGNSDME